MPRLNPREQAALDAVLNDIELFSHHVVGLPLYPYQLEPLRAIIDSVLARRGDEFLLVFPRQSGKNEAVAQLLAYLLVMFQRQGGQIVYGAVGDGLGRGMRRLEERLDSPWTRRQWRKTARPSRYALGRASVAFISSHPGAASRGETADLLLVLDEAQDHDAAHVEAVFTPMRAARNATAVYLGTTRTTGDFLWAKKGELEAAEAADGRRRVYLVPPEVVTAANPDYAVFLAGQVRRYGRRHPIVAAEYFLEPVDGAGGLFPPGRLAMMRGAHGRQRGPRPGELYVATIDPAGGDAAALETGAGLANPKRDFTVATIFRIANYEESWSADALPSGEECRRDAGAPFGAPLGVSLGAPLGDPFGAPSGASLGVPVYEVVDVFVDQGSRHFQGGPGRAALAERLLAYLRHWGPAHTLVDAAGVGQGLADWLAARLGRSAVTAWPLGSASAKARLGSDFLSLVDTGRFRHWTGDEDEPLSDGWWFWQQAAACGYSLAGGGRFDRDLRWGVAERARVMTPSGPQPIHDDRLLSAALVAEVERRRAAGGLLLGASVSRVVGPGDGL